MTAADLPPVRVPDARAAIHREFPGDHLSRCRREHRRAASCRAVTPGGIIIEITDDAGDTEVQYADLITRVKATLRPTGRWQFSLIPLGPRPAFAVPDVPGHVRRDVINHPSADDFYSEG